MSLTSRLWLPLATALIIFCSGCERTSTVETPTESRDTPNQTEHSASRRIVALGDLHGNLSKTIEALRLARLIDAEQHWVGGTTALIQLGDVLDRGNDEKGIIDFFETIRPEAAADGGLVVNLNGNHELMNASGDFRYVNPESCNDFIGLRNKIGTHPALTGLSPSCRTRAAALLPGGAYSRVLAEWPMVYQLEGNVFAHGGLLPLHLSYGVDRINADARAFLLGQRRSLWDERVNQQNAVHWDRTYGAEALPPDSRACRDLERTLGQLGADRLVVAHTTRGHIDSACRGRVWRIDTGVGYADGNIELLNIVGDDVTTIANQ